MFVATKIGYTGVHTDLPPAPDNLLSVIWCNCHTDCNAMRCTFRKHNVKCSLACGNCRGSGCTNLDNFHVDETDDLDYDSIQ